MRRMQGVGIGIVQEFDETQGRLRVDLPWLEEGYRSAWAPVATPMTGGSRGMMFFPEVGDEVLIAWEHGDFDHPFVVGFLWNGVDRAPESERHFRVIVTPGGHTLRFEDKDGAKRIVLKTASGRSLTLDDAPTGGRIELHSGSHTIVMDDAPGGGVTITSPMTLTVNASAAVFNCPVQVTGAVTVTGAMNVTGAVSVIGAVNATSIASPIYSPGVGNLL